LEYFLNRKKELKKLGGKNMKLKILQILLIFLIFIPLANAVEYPSSVGYVNDFANMLSPGDVARLNSEITAIENATTVEIAIVTVDSLQGVSVEEYAVKLFEKWGIGKKSNDNGLLILVARNEREYRIETGYGLEGTITAARAGRIGREIIEPNFKNGDYGKGLYEAVKEIRGLVEQDPSVIARFEQEEKYQFDITVNDVPYTYYLDKNKMNIIIFIVIFSLIPFGVFVKKYTKQAWISLLGVDAILLIAANFDSAGLSVFTLFLLFFQLPFLAVFIFLFRTGKMKNNSGGWSGGGRSYGGGFGGGYSEGGYSGGGYSGSGHSGGGFGGGSSGGGGHSGKW
jgi:uncharacterized protein